MNRRFSRLVMFALLTCLTLAAVRGAAVEPVVRTAERPQPKRDVAPAEPSDSLASDKAAEDHDATSPPVVAPQRSGPTGTLVMPVIRGDAPGQIVAPRAKPLTVIHGDEPSETELPMIDEGEGTEASPPPPFVEQVRPLTPRLENLKRRVRQALSIHYRRPVVTTEQNPWEVMHWVIGYGVNANLRRGAPNGKPVNAIGWLAFNMPCHGQSILQMQNGRVAAQKGVGVQGHYGQFLAILAQSHLVRDYPLKVGAQEFSLEDLIETEKLTCATGMELTFKLIALAHYLESDATWTNDRGEEWSIERLVREEIASPIRGVACGGTHRLMGLSYSYKVREQRGDVVDGEYLRAKNYIADYHKYTFGLQNSDGSFSTQWFVRREAKNDLERRLQTTGHILEWMVYSAEPPMLDDPRLIKAVEYLSGILVQYPKQGWEIGHLGHAAHALSLYDERRFKPLERNLARKPGNRTASAEFPLPTDDTFAPSESGLATAGLEVPLDEQADYIPPTDATRDSWTPPAGPSSDDAERLDPRLDPSPIAIQYSEP